MRAFIGIGSNIEPAENVRRAVEAMGQVTQIRALSTFYRTAPLGRDDQPPFYNGVAEIGTELAPARLKQALRAIEARLGRQRGDDKYAPRTIDLDILLYGDRVIDEPGLVIPDPDITRRAFVAMPLYELAPDLVVPGIKTPLAQIVGRHSLAGMEALQNYSEALRQAIASQARTMPPAI